MTTIRNEIEINAPIASVFNIILIQIISKKRGLVKLSKNQKMYRVKKVKKVQR